MSNDGTEFYLMFMPNIVEQELAEDDQMALIVSNPSVNHDTNVTVSCICWDAKWRILLFTFRKLGAFQNLCTETQYKCQIMVLENCP